MSTGAIIAIIVVIIVIIILLIGGGIAIWYFFFRNNTSTSGIPPAPSGELVKVKGPYSADGSVTIDPLLGGSYKVPTDYSSGKIYGKYGYATARVSAGSLSKTSTVRSEIKWMDATYLIWDNTNKPFVGTDDQNPPANIYKIGYTFRIPRQLEPVLQQGSDTIVYYLYVKKSANTTDIGSKTPIFAGLASSIVSTSEIIITETDGFTEGKP